MSSIHTGEIAPQCKICMRYGEQEKLPGLHGGYYNIHKRSRRSHFECETDTWHLKGITLWLGARFWNNGTDDELFESDFIECNDENMSAVKFFFCYLFSSFFYYYSTSIFSFSSIKL